LQAQVELLQAALQRCPSWTDLELLESRLSAGHLSRESAEESEKLHETLQNRTEELDELAEINAQLQEENEELRHRLTQIEQKLDRQREVGRQIESRLAAAEGLLRESLLSLISPGDEFYEELVEQIQRFLVP
jgi:chromosome segregation ATPase